MIPSFIWYNWPFLRLTFFFFSTQPDHDVRNSPWRWEATPLHVPVYSSHSWYLECLYFIPMLSSGQDTSVPCMHWALCWVSAVSFFRSRLERKRCRVIWGNWDILYKLTSWYCSSQKASDVISTRVLPRRLTLPLEGTLRWLRSWLQKSCFCFGKLSLRSMKLPNNTWRIKEMVWWCARKTQMEVLALFSPADTAVLAGHLPDFSCSSPNLFFFASAYPHLRLVVGVERGM